MLETVKDTKAKLDDGTEVTRVPNLILMSDGAPTTFASAENTKYKIKVQDKDAPNDYRVEEKIGCLTHNTNDIFADKAEERKAESGSWWESGTLSHEAIGPGNNNKPDSADGFMALLTVAYGKEKITEHYYPDPDEDGSANIYTVGFSTNQQTDAMVEMANLVLNPGVNLEKAKGSSVAAVKEVYEAWEKYSKGEKTVVHAPLGGSSDIFEYTVDRPGDGLPKSLNYTDGYYPATSSDELWNAFYQIVNTITSNAKMPTLVTGSATESGYLTYTDPLGKFMKLDAVKALLWNGHVFESPTEGKDSGNTTYTFHGTINNPAYTETNDVSNIKITLTNENGVQVLKVEIPAAAIPLQVNTVKENGNSITMETQEALPVRVFYTVSVDPEYLTDDGAVDVAKIDKVDSDYIADKTDEDGNIVFYSNLFTNQAIKEGSAETKGDATVTFSPALDNPFYYMQEDTYLYTDKDLNTPLKTTEVQKDTTYYFQISYYEKNKDSGNVTETMTTISRKGEDLATDYLKKDGDGNVYLAKGAPRLGNLSDQNTFMKEKAEDGNTTGTASTYYYAYLAGTENGKTENAETEGIATLAEGASALGFGVALGNNGSIGVAPATGSLKISKEVEAAEGQTAPDETFTFEVKLDGLKNQSYSYTKKTANNGEEAGTFTLANGVGKVELKDNESLTITGLPAGTKYTVTETNLPAGFTNESVEKTDEIQADTTQRSTV